MFRMNWMCKNLIWQFSKKKIKVPEISESISEVTISELPKQKGDFINIDDEILIVESDKGSQKVRA